MNDKPVTVPDLLQMKAKRERIVMVTAYDATFAAIFDNAGVDALLVGDSLGMVVQGHKNTLPVTLEHVLYHTAAVARGSRRAHLVADMPFMSYQVSPEEALRSAGRLIQEGGAHAVKLEGGQRVLPQIAKIVAAGIPVMGHIGLTPQSVHQLGGFKVQGKERSTAHEIVADARALEDAGCYAVVLESIPAELAAEVTDRLTVPTIGIGAGARCDGQVLVGYDLLGLNPGFKPKFLKTFSDLNATVLAAVRQYAEEVRTGVFPAEEHTFHAKTLRLVEDLPEADGPERVYGVPV
ncbi:MAG: 3-methyl-2-oxobutanoate hydroxymethyltransferase [Deltaproteobacteria bacterium]|nr:3-methyl-2-oxobutanoate hydroxymethyltransferase [Deltaproteobacteria bacterium]